MFLILEFTKILLLSETYRRPIGDISEISTCFIEDWHYTSETDMTDRRPIGDDMPHRRTTWLRSLIGISTHLNILIFVYFLLIYIYWNNILGHVGFRWVSDEACRGLRSDTSVSAGSPMGLWLVSDNNNIFVNSCFCSIPECAS